MDTLVKLKVTLDPVGSPRVRVRAPGFDHEQTVTQTTEFDIEFCTNQAQAMLTVDHLQKSDHDATTAVIIHSVSFFGIQDPRFAWAGRYRPQYPQPWANEQQDLATELSPHTYLGWNGQWTLTFGVPVFTWIHQTQNLGWIYR